MAGLREFVVQFGTEEQCIEHLGKLRWPGGFVCAGCGGRQAWRLKSRPRVYECATCHRQESATAGTVFHRTRTDLTKWFLAAYLMGRDKRGVSAEFLQRELGVAYQTAWTMAHKLRHGLSEDPSRPLHGFSRSGRDLYRWPRRPGKSRSQHRQSRQEPGRRCRGKGAGAEEPERQTWPRRQTPARVLCRRCPHRYAAGGDGGGTGGLS